MHSSAKRCRSIAQQAMNRAMSPRTRDEYFLWVAEREGKVCGTAFATREDAFSLGEDRPTWSVIWFIGRRVIRELFEAVVARAAGEPVWVTAWTVFGLRGKALERLWRSYGCRRVCTVWEA